MTLAKFNKFNNTRAQMLDLWNLISGLKSKDFVIIMYATIGPVKQSILE